MANSFATGEGLCCYVINRSLVVVDAGLRHLILSGVTKDCCISEVVRPEILYLFGHKTAQK